MPILAVFLPFFTAGQPVPPIDWFGLCAFMLAQAALLLSYGAVIVGAKMAAYDAIRRRYPLQATSGPHELALCALGFWVAWVIGTFFVPEATVSVIKQFAAAYPVSYIALGVVLIVAVFIVMLPILEWVLRREARQMYPPVNFKRFLWVK